MSLDATRWAWMQRVGRSSAKLVLLSIADRADERHIAYPSIARLEIDTELDRKTVMNAIDHLEANGFLTTVKSNGSTTRYILNGVESREQTSPKNGTGTKNGTSPKNGTQPVPKTVPLPVPKTVPKPTNRTYQETTNAQCANAQPKSSDRFEEFWLGYPVKKDKKRARDIWVRKRLDGKCDEILSGVKRLQAQDSAWKSGFIPHASTFLNGERWTDEPKNQPGSETTQRKWGAGAV